MVGTSHPPFEILFVVFPDEQFHYLEIETIGEFAVRDESFNFIVASTTEWQDWRVMEMPSG